MRFRVPSVDTVGGYLLRPKGLDRLNETPRWWRRIDVIVIGVVLSLSLVGLVMIYSATRASTGVFGYTESVIRQTVWVVVGFVVLGVVMAFDYRKLSQYVVWFYGLALLLLVLVLSPLGSLSKGAQAWFQIGGFQLQPSEVAKPVVIFALATYCAMQHRVFALRHVLVAVVIAGTPMLLILAQPDFGTMLVFAAVLVTILMVAGAPGRAIVALVVLAVGLFFLAASFGVLKQYQLDRLGAFLNPDNSVQESAYNLSQSKIAIGSGGLVGKGLFNGTQTSLRYVPEQHTDFIFTVVGEELGFVGSSTVLLLFAVLLWRVFSIARAAHDRLGRCLAAGVLGMLTFQVFENIGMTMGIMPITGIPLPLLSYGGSATLSAFVVLGIALNVGMHSSQHVD